MDSWRTRINRAESSDREVKVLGLRRALRVDSSIFPEAIGKDHLFGETMRGRGVAAGECEDVGGQFVSSAVDWLRLVNSLYEW